MWPSDQVYDLWQDTKKQHNTDHLVLACIIKEWRDMGQVTAGGRVGRWSRDATGFSCFGLIDYTFKIPPVDSSCLVPSTPSSCFLAVYMCFFFLHFSYSCSCSCHRAYDGQWSGRYPHPATQVTHMEEEAKKKRKLKQQGRGGDAEKEYIQWIHSWWE